MGLIAGEDATRKEEVHKRKFDVVAWWGPTNWIEWKDEVLAAIVVCFAQIPESVAFAALAHCPAAVGLHAAWIVGLICALFGGRPGMVNGSAGALASVTKAYVIANDDGTFDGLENLFLSVIIAGLIILVCAIFKMGKFVALVPATVMIGFCNGLAVVIGLGQLPWWQDESKNYVQGDILTCTLIHTGIALVIMYSLPRITKQMPASLICIIIGCLTEYAIFRPMGVTTETIGTKSKFDPAESVPTPFFWNKHYDLSKMALSGDAFMQAITLAMVAMLESLMCLEVMIDLTGTLGDPNKQVWALGVSNVLAGLFGTMGGNSLIELCVMNVQARGTLRASSTLIAAGVLCIVLFAAPVLNLLPSGTLGGIMITVVLDTARWSSVPAMFASVIPESFLEADNRFSRYLRGVRIDLFDTLVILVVSVLTYFFNLMISVGAGMFLASLRFSWQANQPLEIQAVENPENPECKKYRIKGNLFFASKEAIALAFDVDNDPDLVEIDFRLAKVFDFSILHSFHSILERYAEQKKEVRILNLRDATQLQHLLYFGATQGGKDAGISASLVSNSAIA